MARPAWWVAASAWALGEPTRAVPATASEALGSLPELGGLSHRDLGFTGRVVDAVRVGKGG
jgi:hypothetical protein